MVDAYTFPEDKFLLIGKIVKAQGLKGEMRCFPYSRQPDNISNYKEIFLISPEGDLSQPLKLQTSRAQKNMAILRVAGIISRNQSEALTGYGVLIRKDHLPELNDDTYYWNDFINKPVSTKNGENCGIVANMFSNGAQDILVITNRNEEFLVPVTDDIIIQYDDKGIVISPPPGLLEINSGEDK